MKKIDKYLDFIKKNYKDIEKNKSKIKNIVKDNNLIKNDILSTKQKIEKLLISKIVKFKERMKNDPNNPNYLCIVIKKPFSHYDYKGYIDVSYLRETGGFRIYLNYDKGNNLHLLSFNKDMEVYDEFNEDEQLELITKLYKYFDDDLEHYIEGNKLGLM